MNYSDQEHKAMVKAGFVRLIEAGSGWDEYVIDKAARYEKESPVLLRGLQAFVNKEIEQRNARKLPAPNARYLRA